MAKSGSIRQLTLAGVSYDVAADADFARTPNQAIEGQATSGPTNFKYTKQVAMVEGIDIVAAGADRENLLAIAEGTDLITVSYTTADGSAYKSSVTAVTITGDVTQDAKVTVTAIPEGIWEAVVV